MIRTGKHKQLAVALNLQKFYFGFKTIVQSFSSMASSNPSLWISKPYEMIRFLHTYGHYHNFRFVELSRVYHTRGRMTTHIYENLPEMHPSGTKSSARHLASGGCASDMQKSHADTVTVQTWDLMLFRPGRAAVTAPDGQFFCLQSLTRPNRRRSRRLRAGRCR